MAAFPQGLPLPTGTGYRVAPVDQTVRTEMENGRARVRRITRARNDRVTLSWHLNDAQLSIFRDWFDADATLGAAGGAAYFTTSLALGTGGMPVVNARFVKAPEYAYVGVDLWAVSAEVEIQ